MSHTDIRAIVDLRIDFIVEEPTKLHCHPAGPWGPSSTDPTGQEGFQDCLLDRYQLCARDSVADDSWFDFSTCLFRNQAATDTITDGMKALNLTVAYCASLARFELHKLQRCAESAEHGGALLVASSKVNEKYNTHRDEKGFRHPDWVLIDGVDYANNSTVSWLSLVCDAYGGKKPASCKKPASKN